MRLFVLATALISVALKGCGRADEVRVDAEHDVELNDVPAGDRDLTDPADVPVGEATPDGGPSKTRPEVVVSDADSDGVDDAPAGEDSTGNISDIGDIGEIDDIGDTQSANIDSGDTDPSAPDSGIDVDVGPACTPSGARCEGTLRVVCGPEGESATSCPHGCAEGLCRTCTPDTQTCEDDTVLRCEPDGQTTAPVVDCSETGRVCIEGDCRDCRPGGRRCAASIAERCVDSNWQTDKDCAAEGLVCRDGQCVPACAPDTNGLRPSGCTHVGVDLDNLAEARTAPYAIVTANLGTLQATVTVTQRDGPLSSPFEALRTSLTPGAVAVLTLPARDIPSAGLHWSAWHVEATSPILAWQFNPLDDVGVFSNDATQLLPVERFGREHLVLSRAQAQSGLGPVRGGFAVVAGPDGSDVTLVPSAPIEAGVDLPALTAGEVYALRIEPWQVLNVKTANVGDDLTGTEVFATSPVGVFATHDGTQSADRCCSDHLEHQLPPVSAWGLRHLATRSAPRGLAPDYWRIVASENATTVTFTPATVHAPVTLARGEFVEFAALADCIIDSDHPVLVGQLLASSGEVTRNPPGTRCTRTSDCDAGYTCGGVCVAPTCAVAGSTAGCPAGHACACPPGRPCTCRALGDPSLILPAPVSSFATDHAIFTPAGFFTNFVNIATPLDAEVRIDDVPVPEASFIPFGDGLWKVARIAVTEGLHRISASLPAGVIAYGFGPDVSYGYAAVKP